MTIDIDPDSGFCFGVTNAIRQAEEGLEKGPLYCLGDIVHNGEEVERLARKGLETIDYDDLRTLHGGNVLFRAHGEPPATYQIARANGIHVTDATCPVVLKLQERIRRAYTDHPKAQIVIYGQKGHAEVIGLCGQTNNNAIVVESEEDLSKIDFSRDIYLFSQTTKSVEKFHDLVTKIQQCIYRRETAECPPDGTGGTASAEEGIYRRETAECPPDETGGTASAEEGIYRRETEERPNNARPVFEYHDTICRSVANRVTNIRKFAAAHDIIIFVGGKKSSNAKVLYNHCHEANPNTVFVSSPDELTSDIIQYNNIGICGATSTPLWLMENCKKQIESWLIK